MMIQFVRFYLLIAVSFFGLQVQAGPRVIGNGGDPLEIRFKEISQNIYQWIESGNADRIKLPSHITLDLYKISMLSALKEYSIEFLNTAIVVNGMEKTCFNFRVNDINEIRCNVARFQKILETEPNDLYRLIHHEFAGLAGLEISMGTDSNYEISQQISAFLSYQRVRRLPVRSVANQELTCFAELAVRGKKVRTQLEAIANHESYVLKGVLANLSIYAAPLEGNAGFEVLVSKSSIEKDLVIHKELVRFHEKDDGSKFGDAFFQHVEIADLDFRNFGLRFTLFIVSVQCELGAKQ